MGDCKRLKIDKKKHVDKRPRLLEFEVGVSITRFRIKSKLKPMYLGPFEILQWVKNDGYCLVLPPKLSHVHDVFHVSMLRKYELDPSHIIDYNEIEVDENATFIEEPI